jgi:5'-nucleotidase
VRSRAQPSPAAAAALALTLALPALSCLPQGDAPDLAGVPVRLTLLHTSDLHSRIFPYEMEPQYTDERLGLLPGNGPYGGAARMAAVIERERAAASRALHLDSGDCFQGAAVFNVFSGEVEMRALSAMGVDAVVAGNHEFDRGARNYAEMLESFSSFPTLAANYDFADSMDPWNSRLDELVDPVAVFGLDGLTVGVIGMGNLSSITSIYEADNSLDVRVRPTLDTVRQWAQFLDPHVDVVLVLSHLSLDDDVEIAQQVAEVDVVLGGHLHVALDPVKVVDSIAKPGKQVIVSHSGAFAKYVQRVDLVVQDGDVVAHENTLIPIDASIPEDADLVDLLHDYQRLLEREINLSQCVANTGERVARFGQGGGDSPLGNLVAEAMQFRPGIETAFGLTNSLGIRTDLQGPGEGQPLHGVTVEELFNVLPFDNTITTMFLSGAEVQELFDYVSARSAERGCNAQAQISSARFEMDCGNEVALDVTVGGSWAACVEDADCTEPGEICSGGGCGRAVLPSESYELATNDYIASGGSGFDVLDRNTTQQDSGISMRDAVEFWMRTGTGGCESETTVDDLYPAGDGRITPIY